MEPHITLFSVIMLLGAAHGLFLALALVNAKGGSRIGHYFLALLTLAFAIDLGHEFLYQSRNLLELLALAYVDPVINLLYGPCFYLYVRALTDTKPYRFAGLQWLHIFPFVIAVLICLWLPNLSAEQIEKLLYLQSATYSAEESHVMRTLSTIALGSALQIGIYLALSIRRLIQHARRIRQQFSSIERISLIWLRNLLIAISMLYLILLFDGYLSQVLGFGQEINHLLYIMVVVVIYTMGYLGLRQPIIFTSTLAKDIPQTTEVEKPEIIETTKENAMEAQPKAKYQTSALDAEMSAVLRDDLQRYMQSDRPYLDSKLTLTQLATQLGISNNYLSQVINEQFEMNFFDFINSYRVDEAKLLLVHPDQAKSNVLKIALDAGFNSKSAFYTAFKKHTGVTPSEFRGKVTQ